MEITKSYLGTLKNFPKQYHNHIPDPGRIPWDPEDYISFTEVKHEGIVHADSFIIQAGAFEEDPQAATEAVEEQVRLWMDELSGDF